MTSKYKLLEPMLGWTRGELFVLDTEWGEWTRKRTGETFSTRGSTKDGETALLLNYLSMQISFMENVL